MGWSGWPSGWPPTKAGRYGCGLLHGARLARKAEQPPTYFLIPYDVREKRLRARSRRAEDFAAAIAALQSKRLLVILDCCHAGGMDVKALLQEPRGRLRRARPSRRGC